MYSPRVWWSIKSHLNWTLTASCRNSLNSNLCALIPFQPSRSRTLSIDTVCGLQMLTTSKDRFDTIQREAPGEFKNNLIHVTKYQAGSKCKVCSLSMILSRWSQFQFFPSWQWTFIQFWIYCLWLSVGVAFPDMDSGEVDMAKGSAMGASGNPLPPVRCACHWRVAEGLHLRKACRNEAARQGREGIEDLRDEHGEKGCACMPRRGPRPRPGGVDSPRGGCHRCRPHWCCVGRGDATWICCNRLSSVYSSSSLKVTDWWFSLEWSHEVRGDECVYNHPSPSSNSIVVDNTRRTAEGLLKDICSFPSISILYNRIGHFHWI